MSLHGPAVDVLMFAWTRSSGCCMFHVTLTMVQPRRLWLLRMMISSVHRSMRHEHLWRRLADSHAFPIKTPASQSVHPWWSLLYASAVASRITAVEILSFAVMKQAAGVSRCQTDCRCGLPADVWNTSCLDRVNSDSCAARVACGVIVTIESNTLYWATCAFYKSVLHANSAKTTK